MHKKTANSPFKPSTPAPTQITNPTTSASACPYVPSDSTPSSSTPPTPRKAAPNSTISKLNPLNYMPHTTPNQRLASANQTTSLDLSRESSTIPRADGTPWEYPSPQQMYNALLRKGYIDTPADAVPAMVSVHNFLNEGAWAEILEWERRFHLGLYEGMRRSARGEDGSLAGAMIASTEKEAWVDKGVPPPRLMRFMGRPDDLTPKAYILQLLSKAAPKTFGTDPPFDRHDWFVRRLGKDGKEREVRYVIDYYSGPTEETGEPVFYLDVRPAVDGPTGVMERVVRWGGDVWWRASGGVVRENQRAREMWEAGRRV
ncbi:cytochrome c and c1 heme-lyase [Aulographum hederae CBS 113979]|uniref:Holocytochrome c-type synthase n=1 Tax=Aulographum hederae CBS 113979 TaxID=1176131 RepID=A0A6G1H2M7_9PEZI|nr:cytochrome c and c1 heme-lyase [Aulographum hederae CBS 113979]